MRVHVTPSKDKKRWFPIICQISKIIFIACAKLISKEKPHDIGRVIHTKQSSFCGEKWLSKEHFDLVFLFFSQRSKEFGYKLECSLKQSGENFSEAQSRIIQLQEACNSFESKNQDLENKLLEMIEKEQSAEERARCWQIQHYVISAVALISYKPFLTFRIGTQTKYFN